MPILISMYNFKGGVGKTTGTYNLGYLLAGVFGKKVLIVDADPQCNLTGLVHYNTYTGKPEELESFLNKREQDYLQGQYTSIYDLYRTFASPQRGVDLSPERANRVQINQMQVHGYQNLYLMPGDLRLAKIEQAATLGLANVPLYAGIPGYLTNIFRTIAEKHEFDFIIFDLSPSLGGFNQAMLLGSDYFAIPFYPDFFSYQAIQTLTKEIPSLANEQLRKFRSSGELELDPISFIDTTPMFLGAFPQKIKTKTESGRQKLHQTYGAWIKKVYAQTDKLIEALKGNGMVSDKFELKKPIGVLDCCQAALDVQASGRPISDANYKHRHINGDDGTTRAFNKGENDMKTRARNSYRKILATLLCNLSSEHLKSLGGAFEDQIRIYAYASENIDPEGYVAVYTPSVAGLESLNNDELDESWLQDDDVNTLLKYYLSSEQNLAIVTAISGTHLSGKTLENNLRDFDQERSNAGINRAIVPINLRGSHWILLFINFSELMNMTSVYYFDPLGDEIDKQVEQSIRQAFLRSGDIEVVNLDHPIQQDGYSCGNWIVEAARSLVASSSLPEHVNISDYRKEHKNILNQSLQASEQAAPNKKRKKRKVSDHSAPPINTLVPSLDNATFPVVLPAYGLMQSREDHHSLMNSTDKSTKKKKKKVGVLGN